MGNGEGPLGLENTRSKEKEGETWGVSQSSQWLVAGLRGARQR